MDNLPDDVREVLYISYRVVLPVIIFVGTLVSSLSIVVLSDPRLMRSHINMYFLLLAAADLLIFLASIPTAQSLNGCIIYSYNYGLYYINVFSTILHISQAFSMYLLLWISYDRFLAVWNSKEFNDIKKPMVICRRITCTFIMCAATHLFHMADVDIRCFSPKETGNLTSDGFSVDGKLPLTSISSISEMSERQNSSSHSCDEGMWIIDDTFNYVKQKSLWRQIFWIIRCLIVSAIPLLSVVTLNLGIAGGIIHQRLQNTSSNKSTQRRDRSRIYIVLAISFTFLCSITPRLVYGVLYGSNVDSCHAPLNEEIFYAVAKLLILVEHMTHFVIMCFCKAFLDEVKKVFLAAFQCLKQTLSLKPPYQADCGNDNPSNSMTTSSATVP